MNINAIEMMSLNQKNMKFGMKATPTPTEPQAPVTQPNYGMNGLEAQANSNIAFQGSALAAIRNSKAMKYAMGAMFAGVLTTAMPSCSDHWGEPQIINGQTYINVNVNVDFSQLMDLKATIEKLMSTIESMDKTSQDFYKAFLKFVADYEAGRLDDAEFQKFIINAIIEAKADRQTLIGLTADQNDKIDQILDKLDKGEITLADAYKQIMDILNSINNGIHALLAEAQGAHQDYNDKMDEAIGYLKNIDNNTANYAQSLDGLKADLDKLVANTDSIIVILNDPKRNQDIKDLLVQINNDQIKAPWLEALLKNAGVSVEEAINMSTEELKAIIQKGINTYVTYETKKIKIMEFIRDNMPEITSNPEYGAKLTQIVELLNSIDAKDAAANDKLQAIYDKLDAILNNLGCVDCCDEVIELLKEIAAKSHEGVLD